MPTNSRLTTTTTASPLSLRSIDFLLPINFQLTTSTPATDPTPTHSLSPQLFFGLLDKLLSFLRTDAQWMEFPIQVPLSLNTFTAMSEHGIENTLTDKIFLSELPQTAIEISSRFQALSPPSHGRHQTDRVDSGRSVKKGLKKSFLSPSSLSPYRSYTADTPTHIAQVDGTSTYYHFWKRKKSHHFIPRTTVLFNFKRVFPTNVF